MRHFLIFQLKYWLAISAAVYPLATVKAAMAEDQTCPTSLFSPQTCGEPQRFEPIAISGNMYLVEAGTSAALTFKPNSFHTFTMSFNGRTASVDFGGDKVTYGGDLAVDESAKVFFDAVMKQWKTCPEKN